MFKYLIGRGLYLILFHQYKMYNGRYSISYNYDFLVFWNTKSLTAIYFFKNNHHKLQFEMERDLLLCL